jgi:hypothetical protein
MESQKSLPTFTRRVDKHAGDSTTLCRPRGCPLGVTAASSRVYFAYLDSEYQSKEGQEIVDTGNEEERSRRLFDGHLTLQARV